MAEIRVYRAETPGDLQWVAKSAHEEIYDEQQGWWVEALISRLMNDSLSDIFVVLRDREMAGFMALQWDDTTGDVDAVKVSMLVLHEDYRGHGVLLRALVRRSIALYQEKRKTKVYRLIFEVDSWNEGLAERIRAFLERLELRHHEAILEGAWPPSVEDPKGNQYVFNVWLP